jgi:hypothetical protein
MAEGFKLRHWGIWIGDSQSWVRFDSNNIFWTTSYEVAQSQLEISSFADRADVEVREFLPMHLTSCETLDKR